MHNERVHEYTYTCVSACMYLCVFPCSGRGECVGHFHGGLCPCHDADCSISSSIPRFELHQQTPSPLCLCSVCMGCDNSDNPLTIHPYRGGRRGWAQYSCGIRPLLLCVPYQGRAFGLWVPGAPLLAPFCSPDWCTGGIGVAGACAGRRQQGSQVLCIVNDVCVVSLSLCVCLSLPLSLFPSA